MGGHYPALAMATVASPRAARLRARAAPRLAALSRAPRPLVLGAGMFALLAFSAYLRTRQFTVGYWTDEGISVSIGAHHLLDIPGLMRQDGSPPLYYMLLHVWMGVFGSSESATHGLSLLFSLLCIPVALWAGWSLWGERAGWIAAALFALNPFLDVYAQETRMYGLLGLEGLVAAAAFLHAYVYRRQRYAPLFGLGLAVTLYTHNWGLFLGVGCGLALIPCWRALEKEGNDRRAFLRDVAVGFGLAAVLYAPWLPTLLFQSAHTGAPWTNAPSFGVPIVFSRSLLGGGAATGALLLGGGFGLYRLIRSRRGDGLAARAALWLGLGAIVVNYVTSQISPSFNPRYLAAVAGVTLLLGALGLARGGRLGLVALAAIALLWIVPTAHHVDNKSNAREIALELDSALRPGDLVILGQPEQVPLFRFYFPAGMRWATELGATPDPGIFDWRDAVKRLTGANVVQELDPLLATVTAGQRVVFVRPVTSYGNNWNAPWTQLVRRRSAQWGAALSADPRLVRVAAAPLFYRPEATDIAMHAVVYVKRS